MLYVNTLCADYITITSYLKTIKGGLYEVFKSLILSSFLLGVFFVVGCNDVPTTTNEIVGTNQQLSKTATSATLHIYNYFANEQTINIYAVSSDWIECDVDWSTQPTTYPTLEGSF